MMTVQQNAILRLKELCEEAKVELRELEEKIETVGADRQVTQLRGQLEGAAKELQQEILEREQRKQAERDAKKAEKAKAAAEASA